MAHVLVLVPYFLPIAFLYAPRGLYGMFTTSRALLSGVDIGIPFAILWAAIICLGLWLPRREVA